MRTPTSRETHTRVCCSAARRTARPGRDSTSRRAGDRRDGRTVSSPGLRIRFSTRRAGPGASSSLPTPISCGTTAQALDGDRRRALNTGAIRGVELVRETARLASMNMLLHGIGQPNGSELIEVRDSLAKPPSYDRGRGARQPAVRRGHGDRGELCHDAAGPVGRDHEQAAQLRPAHLHTAEAEAAAPLWSCLTTYYSRAVRARRYAVELLQQLRRAHLAAAAYRDLLCGRCQGKHLVLRQEAATAGWLPSHKRLWVYDFRTAQHFTMKQNPLRREHLDDFIKCFRPGEPARTVSSPSGSSPTTYEELIARDKINLDFTFLREPEDRCAGGARCGCSGDRRRTGGGLAEFSPRRVLKALKSAREDSPESDLRSKLSTCSSA